VNFYSESMRKVSWRARV